MVRDTHFFLRCKAPKYFLYKSISLLSWLGLCCGTGFPPAVKENGPLLPSCSAHASHCGGFSCCGAQTLGCSGSSSCNDWAWARCSLGLCTGSRVVVHRLSCFWQHVGSSWMRDGTHVSSSVCRQTPHHWATEEAPEAQLIIQIPKLWKPTSKDFSLI